MRLGVDMDGVICRFNEGWTAIHRSEFGTDVHAGLVVKWDGLHEIGGFGDMDAFWKWAGPQDHRPSIFRHLEAFDGAVETLHRLAADGHDLVIITAKPPWAVPDTLFWLADHSIPVVAVHFVEDKASVDCDLYIDDAQHNLLEIQAARPEATVVRMVQPWNDPVEGVVDVREWTEIYEVVTSLSQASGDSGASFQ